jgi:hypothetical protein
LWCSARSLKYTGARIADAFSVDESETCGFFCGFHSDSIPIGVTAKVDGSGFDRPLATSMIVGKECRERTTGQSRFFGNR